MACDTYPMCQGSWWPEMNFDKAFELWRPLGMDAQGGNLPFQALTAIHFVHRWHAVLVVVLLAASALGLHRHGLPAQGKVLFLLIGLQFATGISNAVLGWPLLAALLHTGAAAAMLVLQVWCLSIAKPQHPQHIAATFSRPML